MFDQLNGHPAITLNPNLNANTIFLRNIVDGRRTLVTYQEDKDTELWRDNLKKINTCFSQHMIDLRIKDEASESQVQSTEKVENENIGDNMEKKVEYLNDTSSST